MKTFDEIYSDVLEKSKDELEELRHNMLIKVTITIVLAIIAGIIIYIFINNFTVVGILMIIVIIVGVIWMSSSSREYTKVYKDKVVRRFINEYNSELQYDPKDKIPSSLYREAGFETYYDRYYSEDVIKGKIDEHDILMGEVHTEREETTTDSDGNTTTHYVTIFHGMFGYIKINNIYNGQIKIHSDKGKLGKLFGNKKRVEMDSSEFEKYFDVYADDPIQVMQILTSDIMEQMIEFRKNHKTKFEITIQKDNLFIRFLTGSMFEANVLKSSVNEKTLRKIYDIINFTFDITRSFLKVSEETQI